MRTLDLILAWAVLLLGCVHMAATSSFYVWSMSALWFISGGLSLIFLGIMNLLRIYYAAVAPGTRTAAVIANVLTLAFMVGLAEQMPLRSNPQVIAVGVAVIAEFAFSIWRRDPPPTPPPAGPAA